MKVLMLIAQRYESGMILKEDICQEFLSGKYGMEYYKTCQFPTEAAFKSWCREGMQRAAVKLWRKQGRGTQPGHVLRPVQFPDANRDDSVGRWEVASENDDPALAVQEAELISLMKVKIASLPKMERIALTQKFMKGKSYKDIGMKLNLPAANISALIQRVLSQLRQELG